MLTDKLSDIRRTVADSPDITYRELLAKFGATAQFLQGETIEVTRYYKVLDELAESEEDIAYFDAMADQFYNDEQAFRANIMALPEDDRQFVESLCILHATREKSGFFYDQVNDFLNEYSPEIWDTVEKIHKRLPFIDKMKQFDVYWNAPVMAKPDVIPS